jgi:DNA polymerase zeta
MDTFRVRLNCIDSYQAVPNEFDPPVPLSLAGDHAKDRPKVSVIRVFGATETGQKVLMHIHGAFQYTYIEYGGSLIPEDVNAAIRTLHLSIDHALAVSYRKNIYDGRIAYVAHISLVKGIPFYGFHVGYKFYLKIYLLNPLHMTRLADLLREGAVMKRVLQPYESHMQYLAQWMCDYNLYGCAYVDCQKVKFRAPIPKYVEMNLALHQWHDRSIPPNFVSDEAVLPKQGHCSLEVDVCVQDILNRRDVESRPLHHDFIERIHPLPADAKWVPSMAGLWKDETRRRKARMGLTDPNSSPFPPEVLITMSADPRNTEAGGWIHEEEFRAKAVQIAAEEFEKSDKRMLTFDTYVRQDPLEDSVKTALESVGDLWPENLARGSAYDAAQTVQTAGSELVSSQVLVDENRIHEVSGEYPSDSGEMHLPPNGERGKVNGHQAIVVQPSSARDKSDSDLEVTPPISSSEFEKLGIRRQGDFSHTEEDTFQIPAEYARREASVSGGNKRILPSALKIQPPKRKRLMDEDNLLPDFAPIEAEDDRSSCLEPSNSRLADYGGPHPTNKDEDETSDSLNITNIVDSHGHPEAAKPLSQSQGTTRQISLAFPIVKDPNDPNTILCLSQQSSSPDKSLQGRKMTDVEKATPAKSFLVSSQKTPTSAATASSMKSLPVPSISLRGLSKPVSNRTTLIFQQRSPSTAIVKDTMLKAGLPDVIYQEAFYSNEDDVPDRQREYAGREFKLESATVPFLPDFDPAGKSPATFGQKVPILVDQAAEEKTDSKRRRWCKLLNWSISDQPPSKSEVVAWLEEERRDVVARRADLTKTSPIRRPLLSQVDGPTQKNKYGFKYSQKQASTRIQHETQYMSLMSLEVHVNTRGNLAPNPEHDEVECIFWCVQSDDEDLEMNGDREGLHLGILALSRNSDKAMSISRNVSVDVDEEGTELDLLMKMVDIVRHYDPDILTGYEVHNSSWGYLIERARLKYDFNFCDELSRMKSQSHGRFGREEDRWGFNKTSTIRVTGRHTINIWRAMRCELNLLQYTMENVVFHLLHRRIPHFNFADLTKWYQSKNPRDLSKVIEYFLSRVQIDLEILESNELVPRTSEQARLIGVDWFSVISRGSQFKVENIMFRIAKPENFIVVSPSRRQVGRQNALECIPLVMEPLSDFYTSPVLVLDFQSLYPSVMIAYNYCYSTFLGRVVSWRGTNKMGFTDYRREHRLLELLKDHINIAPNGIMYVKGTIRKSLLAKMLGEILETRVMVKSGMKVDTDDKTLQRLLNNRQLALKLIANVTYGYTSASFSGRMPCSEIADSIVQTARETLEKSIALIHSVEQWGAEVVYGDTDSLFVYLKGRTRAQAFDIGEDIAATITKMNPRPVKLKFEKVYHPCVLLAKKRYVGFKYEHRNQKEPEFDAKGIETVRRDGTPAEQKIEENALKILFRTADLSQVKSFFQSQCGKIMRGEISIQDFCFAKEVRLGTYSEKGPPPPGALISARRMLEDPRLEPQYGERVPYVVITGGPQARLIDRCVAPEVLLHDAQSELDAEYYISKNIIPPLERIFNLVGANVRQWYDEMPKYQRIRRIEAALVPDAAEAGLTKKTLESYMKSSTCIVCREALDSGSPLCQSCFSRAPQTILHLRCKLARSEKKASLLAKVCRSCSGLGWNEEIKCDSKDCPVFYSRTRHKADHGSTQAQIVPVIQALEEQKCDGVDW